MLLRVTTLAGNDRDAGYLEPVLSALHEANLRRERIELIFASVDGQVSLFCRVPLSLKHVLLEHFADAYPTCIVEQIDERAFATPFGGFTHAASLGLSPDVFPIKEHPAFGDLLERRVRDPVCSFLTAVRTGRAGRLRATISLTIRPASEHRHRQARRVLRVTAHRFPFEWTRDVYDYCSTNPRLILRCLAWALSWGARRGNEIESTGADKISQHLFETSIVCQVEGPKEARSKATIKLLELIGAFGTFTSNRSRFHLLRVGRRPRFFRGSLLSVREIATLWHPPLATVQVTRQQHAPFRRLDPPFDLPKVDIEHDVTLMGRALDRRRQPTFGMRLEDRRQHTYIVGKSGTGKSTLLAQMAASDIASGHGVCFIDPHGDITESLLNRIPKSRTNDVILFDPSDQTHPVGFNPLCINHGCTAERTADGLVSAFIKVFQIDPMIATRMLHILRNSVMTLVSNPGSTMIGLERLLVDDAFRNQMLVNVSNPVVRTFWLEQYARWSERQRIEYIASLQNKLGALLTNPSMQNILGQRRSQIDLRLVMDCRKILLVNLSKGAIGEEGSHFLGSLIVALLQVAAMSRIDTPESERADFMLYVDELQNFITPTFALILSESRKFRMSLTCANQYLAQLDADRGITIRDAMFGNIGSIVTFRVGPDDTRFLAHQLGRLELESDLLALPNHHAIARLLIDGVSQSPFVMKTMIPTTGPGRSETIRRVSRQNHGRHVDRVRREIDAMHR